MLPDAPPVRPRQHANLPVMPRDTTPEALRVQTEAQRRLGGPGRFRLACQMSQTVRNLALARIKRRNPSFDERAALDELMWELYGFRRNA
jgi:hypothetical protein